MKIGKKIDLMLYSALLAGFTVVVVLTASIFSSLTPQDVIAPAGSRGDFKANFPIETVAYGPCANLSDYSLCSCDAETMQASAVKYLAEHRT